MRKLCILALISFFAFEAHATTRISDCKKLETKFDTAKKYYAGVKTHLGPKGQSFENYYHSALANKSVSIELGKRIKKIEDIKGYQIKLNDCLKEKEFKVLNLQRDTAERNANKHFNHAKQKYNGDKAKLTEVFNKSDLALNTSGDITGKIDGKYFKYTPQGKMTIGTNTHDSFSKAFPSRAALAGSKSKDELNELISPEDKKMSTGTKVMIGTAVLAAGAAIYAYVDEDKKDKKKKKDRERKSAEQAKSGSAPASAAGAPASAAGAPPKKATKDDLKKPDKDKKGFPKDVIFFTHRCKKLERNSYSLYSHLSEK